MTKIFWRILDLEGPVLQLHMHMDFACNAVVRFLETINLHSLWVIMNSTFLIAFQTSANTLIHLLDERWHYNFDHDHRWPCEFNIIISSSAPEHSLKWREKDQQMHTKTVLKKSWDVTAASLALKLCRRVALSHLDQEQVWDFTEVFWKCCKQD